MPVNLTIRISEHNYQNKNTHHYNPLLFCEGFPDGSVVKNPPASAGDTGDPHSILGLGRPPGGGHGNSLQFLVWRIPWTEESGKLQSMGLQRVGCNCASIIMLAFIEKFDIFIIFYHVCCANILHVFSHLILD